MSDLQSTVDIGPFGATGTLWSSDYSFNDTDEPPFEYFDFLFNESAQFFPKAASIIDGRLESSAETSYPGVPEEGQIVWRTDKSPSRLSVRDEAGTTWRELLFKSEFDGHKSGSNPHQVTLEKAVTAGSTTDNTAEFGGLSIGGESVATESWVSENGPAVTSVSEGGASLTGRASYLNFEGNLNATVETDGGVTVDDAHTHDDLYAAIDHHHDTEYAQLGHSHDSEYYTQSTADSLLADKADAGHTHDSRYYTESELDSKLNAKSNTGHNHDSRYYTQSEVDSLTAPSPEKESFAEVRSDDPSSPQTGRFWVVE